LVSILEQESPHALTTAMFAHPKRGAPANPYRFSVDIDVVYQNSPVSNDLITLTSDEQGGVVGLCPGIVHQQLRPVSCNWRDVLKPEVLFLQKHLKLLNGKTLDLYIFPFHSACS